MFGLLTRLFRVLWRQESDGSGGQAVILEFPIAAAQDAPAAVVPPAPVAFIRQTGTRVAVAEAAGPLVRPLSLQLQGVARLNAPAGRPRPKPYAASAAKPKPLTATPGLKRVPNVKPGAVLSRIQASNQRRGAAVVDLAEVRADARRAKQIETTDREIVALFH